MEQNRKKVYTIQINGLKESVNLVESLNSELKSLEKTIKNLSNSKIKIQSEVNVDKAKLEKKVVSGNEGDTSNRQQMLDKERELALQRQITQEIKATAKAQASVTDEYRKSLEETLKQQNAAKEVKQEMTDMLNGARDAAGNYTNTIAGLRAELRNLVNEQKSVDLASEEYKKLDDRILQLTSNLKSLEQAHGDFRRNVGNYPTQEVEEFRKKFEQLYGDMKNLVQQSNDLQRELNETAPGTEQYNELERKLSDVNEQLKKARESVDNFNASLKQTPQSFEIQVGDTIRNFNSVRDASRTLTLELQRMAAAGQTDTKQFEDTIKALGRLKTSIQQTSNELQSYVGNAKGLNDTLEIMRGATGIVSIGQGLRMLFGGMNEDLDESIKKFAGLTLVIQGVETQVKQFNDNQNKYGDILRTVWGWLDKIGKYSGLDRLSRWFDKLKTKTEDWGKTLKTVADWDNETMSQAFSRIIRQMFEMGNALDGVSNKIKDDLLKPFNKFDDFRIIFDTSSAEEKLDKIDFKIVNLEEQLEELNSKKLSIQASGSEEDLEEINVLIAKTEERIKDLNQLKVSIQTGNTDEYIKSVTKDLDDLDKSIEELEARGVDTKGLKELAVELRTIALNADTANKNIGKTPTLLRTMGNMGVFAAKCLQWLNSALKTGTIFLKNFLKSMVMLYAMQKMMELLTWSIEKLGNAWNVVTGKGGMKFEDRLDMISKSAERARKSLEDYNAEVDRAEKAGMLTGLEAMQLKLDKTRDSALGAAKALKEFLKRQKEIKGDKLENNLNAGNIMGDAADIKNIDEFVEHYRILEKAVAEGTDKIEAGWKRGSGALLTAGDAVEQLETDTKAVLGDMQNEINKINFNNPEEAMKQFIKITDNELYQSAIANMEKLFPKEEWAQELGVLYKEFSDMVGKCEGRTKDLREAIIKANADLIDQAELSNINAISDPQKRQEALRAREKKKRQKDINDSLADEKYKKEALAALDKEYDQKKKEDDKKYAKEALDNADKLASNLKKIRDNQIATLKEGLDKEIKLLEEQRDEELREANKAGKNRGELILSIQEKYNYLIQKKREDWYKKHKKAIDDFNSEILDVERKAAMERAKAIDDAEMGNINRGLQENENQHSQRSRGIQYNAQSEVGENLASNERQYKAEKDFHERMLKETSRYLDEKYRLESEKIKQNEAMLLQDEENQYKEQVRLNERYQKEKLQQTADMLEQGVITEEDAQRMQLDIEEKYLTAGQDLYDAHCKRIEEIQKNAQQEQKNLQENALKERQDAQTEANNNIVKSIEDMFDDIEEISEREERKNTNKTTGLFNLAKERKRLKDVKKEYEKVIGEINEEYDNLKEKFEKGEINFSQYDEGIKSLDNLKKKAKDKADETGEAISTSFQKWGKSLDEFVQQVAGQLQTMFSFVDAIWSAKLDGEESRLQKEQEQLDRESQIVEQAYDKQAEIVQRYKDKINETEDELSTARGERRLALIDSMAKQREQYLLETEALQKQQLEKEKIAKKEEQLKKKQDELEKKRKKQEKVQKLVSATINTATGVTQALAAYPPPLSTILAAAVGALGSAQIAMISAQKYAKGGVIDAPSHTQGGYKIPTKKGISEVEGNEFIVNKKTTMNNEDILYYINNIKRKVTLDDMERFFDNKGKFHIPTNSASKYAQGGQLGEIQDFNLKATMTPSVVIPELHPIVQVVDIANAMDNYTQVQTLAGLAD
jgi:DNA repair exonuclease SbcCD ATPase subunit